MNKEFTLFDQPAQTVTSDRTEGSWYNTINEEGAELSESKKKAGKGEDIILGYFAIVKKSTAVGAARALNMNESSAKRCCTVLMKEGKLRMLPKEDMVMGFYGVKVHLYELVNPK